jgi:hypothetical protein
MIFRISQPVLWQSFCVFVAGIGVVWLQNSTVPKQDTVITKSQYEKLEQEQKTSLDILSRSPSLGYSNIIANWAYLNFIQYFGDNSARDQTGYGLSSDYFWAIIKRDPKFVMAYSILDPATTLFAGQPAESVAIMSDGLQHLSPNIKDAYLVWSYKGIDELLFLGQGAEAQQSYEMASKWGLLQNDDTSKILATRFAEIAEFLQENKESKKAQAGSWLMVLSNAKDQKTIQMALDKIRELGGEVTIENNRVNVKFPP